MSRTITETLPARIRLRGMTSNNAQTTAGENDGKGGGGGGSSSVGGASTASGCTHATGGTRATITLTSNSATTSRNQQQHHPPRQKCCFCWCWCCSCAWERCRKWLHWFTCLAFKTPSANSSMKRGSSDFVFEGEQPTLEEIRGWGKSFDKLMKSTNGRKLFRDFLRSEFSEENILFWLACEELKKEVDNTLIEERTRTIYEDYVSILSPREVSLDSRVRDVINRNMVEPTPHTFDEAQIQIYTLMHRDSYPRFLNSQKFKTLAQFQDGVSASGSTTESPT